MNDNPLPIKKQPDQEFEQSSTSSGQSSIPPSSDMPGQTNDPMEPYQKASSDLQESMNPSSNSIADRPKEVLSVDRTLPSSRSPDSIEQAWLDKTMVDEMRSRWNAIQVQFVDSPCAAVEQGETLVAEIVERLSQILNNQQDTLNQKWLNHDDITTEELRLILRDYRTFMDRLLKI